MHPGRDGGEDRDPSGTLDLLEPMRIGGWLTFPLAAITLAVAVGCGSVEARSSEAPAQDPSTSVSSTDTLGSTDTTEAAPTDIGVASDPVPAVKEMSVFSQPRTEADPLPASSPTASKAMKAVLTRSRLRLHPRHKVARRNAPTPAG
jgi:hypothetical protein